MTHSNRTLAEQFFTENDGWLQTDAIEYVDRDTRLYTSIDGTQTLEFTDGSRAWIYIGDCNIYLGTDL